MAHQTIPTTIRAVEHDRFGPPDVLRVGRRPRPHAGAGEVLVEVRAAGVDRGVWHLVAGLPYLIRLAGFGVRRPRRPVPGLDLAGHVLAVGEGVTSFAPGDAVLGIGRGTWAEVAVADATKLVAKPAAWTFEEAAATAISGVTAHEALHRHGGLAAGERVLVLGASGGVGSFAVQLAAAAGATVTGVASAAKADLVRRLGAHQVLDHATLNARDHDAAGGTGRYDLIVDAGGLTSLRRLRRSLTEPGRLVIVGGEGGGRWTGGVGRQLRARLLSPFVSQRLTSFLSSETAEALDLLVSDLVSHQLTPAVEQRYPLEMAATALTDLAAGRVRGKAVIILEESPDA